LADFFEHHSMVLIENGTIIALFHRGRAAFDIVNFLSNFYFGLISFKEKNIQQISRSVCHPILIVEK